MPRTARVKSESGVYHIVLRGINKQTVFYDDEDREVLLNCLKLIKETDDYEIYAFCFMSNHIHLLLREKEISIGQIIRKILCRYVLWYNRKYERVGNLFQDRYKSEPIENDAQLLCAVRYIHQNPVKAGMVNSPAEYRWSSYSAYLNKKESFIEKNLILSILQTKKQYIKYMEEKDDSKFLEPTETFKISDEKLLKEIKNLLNIKDVADLYSLPKKERNEKILKILEIEGCNPYQVSRVTGISMGVIRFVLA